MEAPDHNTLNLYQILDLLIKILGLAGVFYGFRKVHIEWKRDFIKKIFETQYKCSIDISELATKLTFLPKNEPEYIVAKEKLQQLRWGSYLLVISEFAGKSVDNFFKELEIYEKSGGEDEVKIAREIIERRRNALVHSLRKDLENLWKINHFNSKDYPYADETVTRNLKKQKD